MPIPAVLGDAGPTAKGLFKLIDALFTSDDERMSAKLRVIDLEKSGMLEDIVVNTQEVPHASLFVAGWRPFIGWICGLTFAWTFLMYPLLQFLVITAGLPADMGQIPMPDLAQMIPVVLGMLGLGAMRSYERKSGSERNCMGGTSHDRRDGG